MRQACLKIRTGEVRSRQHLEQEVQLELGTQEMRVSERAFNNRSNIKGYYVQCLSPLSLPVSTPYAIKA